MQRSILAFAISTALVFTTAPTDAAQRGQGGGPKVKPAGATQAPKIHTTKVQAPKIQAPKVKSGGAPKVKAGGSTGPKVKTAPVKTARATKSTGPKVQAAKSTTKSPKTTTASRSEKSTTRSTTTTATTTTTSGGTTPGSTNDPLSPVQQKLQRNTKLADKLSGRLPAGTDVMLAADGFRNLGQFVAAVNVSNNLGIPFTQLKTSMVDDGLSLGQSIQKLRPSADSGTAVRRAETDANVLIRTSTNTTTPTSTTAFTTTTTTPTTSTTSTTTTASSKTKPPARSRQPKGKTR